MPGKKAPPEEPDMRPEKLWLRNFGPFTGDALIDFNTLDDIFLITGKTGSGKTTIFDAIGFALYGAVPGSRRGYVSRLRSDYAGEDHTCGVSLEFSLGNRRYRVDRNPKQEKPKKRGTGTTTMEETAALYEILREELVRLSVKKSEADQKIRDLIGLEAEEFFKIVLLPQGEFAEFLRQNSSNRREVLGKLFPVDKAARLRELAQEKSREAGSALREAERVLEEINRRVSFDTYGELHDRAAEALEKTKRRLSALGQEASRLREIAGIREREREAADRLGETGEALARLAREEPAMAEKERTLARSRQAQPLGHHLLRAAEKQAEAERGAAEHAEAAALLAAAEQAERDAEAGAAELPGLEAAAGELREKRPLLLAMREEEEKLRQETREIRGLQTRLETLAAQRESTAKKLRNQEDEIARAETLSRGVKEFDLRWETDRGLVDRLVQLKKLAAEGEALETELRAALDRAEALEQSRAELETRVPVLEAELEQRRREKEAQERSDMAAHLSETLSPGEPCPVCGSREHPLPAAAAAPVFGLPERIRSLEHARRDAERDLAARTAEGEAQREQGQRTRQRIAALEQPARELKAAAPPSGDPELDRFFAEPAALPEPAAVERLLAVWISRLNESAARRSESRRGADRAAELYREREGLQAAHGEGEREYAGLTEEYRLRREAAEETRRRHGELLAEWNLPGAEEALAEWETRGAALDRRVRELRDQREKAGRDLATARTREEGARHRLDTAAELAREGEAALRAALEPSPFASAEELAAAILPGETEARLEGEIARRREERSRLETLGEELEHRLRLIRAEAEALGDAPETAAIGPRLTELESAQGAAEAERDRASRELAALERDEALLREAAQRREVLAERSFQLKALADDLAGKNPKNTAFDAWLLSRYLAEVAAYASKRLLRMSESRYTLLLDSGTESGRARTGLDLAVFDGYTGKQRPCGTLSGGESFMAAISLALGLADSIQARSGGVRLDAVFIDEGFGSLDEGSLDKALVILDELRDHRMVGLISHVGEMRSRIPSRVEVVKTATGSKIRID
jgi:exonuclease SbcC